MFGLDEEQIESTIIYGDNQNVISLAENLKFHSRSKHIELQFHLYEPKWLLEKSIWNICFIENMVVDIFIKKLHRKNMIIAPLKLCCVPRIKTYPNLLGVLYNKLF